MKSDLDALVELIKPFAVEQWRAGPEQRKDAVRKKDDPDDRYDPFGRRDFVLLMISIAILGFGIWWFTPW